MPVRVFIDEHPTPAEGDRLPLAAPEAHYALRVRRVRAGGQLELLDGDGGRWQATLVNEDPRKTTVEVTRVLPQEMPSPPIHLLVGRPDVPACLELITGACELGVTSIRFLTTRFAQPRDPGEGRVRKTIRAAMRQSGRPSPPAILPSCTLEVALDEAAPLPSVYGAMTSEDAATDDVLAPCNLLVGPEGGLHEQELTQLRARGWIGRCISPWVLRTPTAAMALVAKTSVSQRP